MRKQILIGLLMLTSFAVSAETYIKLNGVMAALGIFNPAVEVGVAKHFTFQMDMTVSPWQKYIHDAPFVVVLGAIDGRWYPKGKFNGFYIGPTLGYASYKMQRYDYWDTDNIQYGSSIFYGADIGYMWHYKNWSFEPTLAYGWQLAHYEGYNIKTGERYDIGLYPGELNASSEWIPFKGGLMIGYKF